MPRRRYRPTIVLLGDSLTQLSFDGWGATLANVYQRRADVVNRGYSGYNTRFYLKLPWLQESSNDQEEEEEEEEDDALRKACLVVIFFGANDAALKDVDPHHYVSLEEYAQNLEALVARVRAHNHNASSSKNILLVTPPPVHHEQRLVYQKQRYGDKATGILERTLENTGLYAAACRQVASQLQLPCLDLYTDMKETAADGNNDDWSRFLCDGLHFSAAGHAFVSQALLGAIAHHFPHLHVTADPRTGQWCNIASTCSALGSQGPYHDEIDANDPDKAFAS